MRRVEVGWGSNAPKEATQTFTFGDGVKRKILGTQLGGLSRCSGEATHRARRRLRGVGCSGRLRIRSLSCGRFGQRRLWRWGGRRSKRLGMRMTTMMLTIVARQSAVPTAVGDYSVPAAGGVVRWTYVDRKCRLEGRCGLMRRRTESRSRRLSDAPGAGWTHAQGRRSNVLGHHVTAIPALTRRPRKLRGGVRRARAPVRSVGRTAVDRRRRGPRVGADSDGLPALVCMAGGVSIQDG